MATTREGASDAPALDRGLSVLEYVVEAGRPVAMKEVATALAIPAASAFRLVRTLVGRGYLDEVALAQQSYVPGRRLFGLVQRHQSNHSLPAVARLPLRDLAERTGQTAQLAILEGASVVYVEQAMPKEPVSIVAPLHSRLPINVSAAGKILCAQLRADELDAVLVPDNLRRKTENTIGEASELIAAIDEARGRGFATDLEEFARGIGCVAAAVWDGRAHCVGALGVTGHIEPYQRPETFAALVAAVTAVAEEVSRKMGYAGPYPRR